MYQTPKSHVIDPLSGVMTGATGRYEKKLSELSGIYLDTAAFEAECARRGDDVVYTVHEARPRQDHGDLIFGTTFMEPGRIGNEFFVTRGHIHAVANRPETYYGESGTGLMLLESPEGETKILPLDPRVLVYVPPMWIHRTVNIGTEPLVLSFCYPCDSGQDYGIIAKSGGMETRIVADGDGWKAIRNPNYRPRTEAEVRRILATADQQ